MHCIFCQRYNKYRHLCLACRTGFVNWVKGHVLLPEGSTCSLALAAHKYLNHILSNRILDFQSIKDDRPSDNPPEWPGFYHGNGKWTIPHNPVILPVPITPTNAVEVLTGALSSFFLM